MNSILQAKDDNRCFLCMLDKNASVQKALHWHHIFYGTANRKLSEKYGLKVKLCLDNHTGSTRAVHFNKAADTELKKIGQYAFEKRWPRLCFRDIFGKNYLDNDEHPKPEKRYKDDLSGFIRLEDE